MAWQEECAAVCEQCKKHNKDKTCKTCNNKPPDVMSGNYDIMELWKFAGSQWISSGLGVIGVNYPAVFDIARILGIEVDENLLFKIKCLEEVTLERNKDA